MLGPSATMPPLVCRCSVLDVPIHVICIDYDSEYIIVTDVLIMDEYIWNDHRIQESLEPQTYCLAVFA